MFASRLNAPLCVLVGGSGCRRPSTVSGRILPVLLRPRSSSSGMGAAADLHARLAGAGS
jgi:hypothetical protein